MDLTRRSILQAPAAALGASPAAVPAGHIRPRPSKAIAASPLSIGFETLDRQSFDPARTYSHIAELGVKWARCQTGWCRSEKRKGEYDFRWLDGIVDSLRAAGVQPWFNLGYGNILYTPGAPHPTAVGFAPVFSEEARTGWLRFVQAMAQHYRSRVTHWEIWNEPNLNSFWRPNKPNPADYVGLVKITARAIRQVIPGAVIIGGAFARIPYRFTEECLRAGMAQHIDKLSYHPYRPLPELNYGPEVRALRSLVDRYKPGIGLWQGENGAPSSTAKDSAGALSELAWNETSQAKWLLRRLLSDIALGIELTSYFLIVDIVNYFTGTTNTKRINYKGVLRGGVYTRKRSYYALQNLCALFDAQTVKTELTVQVEGGASPLEDMLVHSASFIRNGRALYAFWYPADLQQEYTPRRARIRVWSGGAASITEPVFVDLLSGEIRRPAAAQQAADGFWVFDDVEVRDYPLLIADAKVVL
ncbi:MAG: beta-galactosidase [Bryobacteraceae bacterium]|nr:beta-galactosidase [Bryobacterales bacterium]NUN01341.1 beta-galactosidase [Bryobacteraceae bacterium]